METMICESYCTLIILTMNFFVQLFKFLVAGCCRVVNTIAWPWC